MTATPMLEMRGITKRFPGVLANDRVDFDVLPGEIHTLLGENGAGKSTLMRILYGLYRQDAGEVLLNGEPIDVHGPHDAIAHGIGMIHQHFMLVPTLTVAENVALGLRSSRGPLTDLDAVSERIEDLAETYRLRVDPRALVWQLAVGERQRIEILKALYRDATLLVLDEPTAVLTPQEVDDLFVTLRRMAEDGRGLIFISHKLREVLAISDRITVMRAGRVTGHTTPAETSRQELAHMMVGRDVKLVPDRPPVERGPVRLSVQDLRVTGDRGAEAVRSLDLEAVGGEILGIAGVSGNGQRELAETIAGLRSPVGGTVSVDGVDVTGRGPSVVRAAGLAYIPEERMRDGVIGEFTVTENLMLVDHAKAPYLRGRWFMRFGAIRERCRRLVHEYAVKTPSLDTRTRNLSGGNIQKLILARELSQTPSVLLACQPTRGVDIGASEYIHARLVEQRAHGVAIVVVSEDLDEVLALSDRIAVMYEGRVVAMVDAADAVREELGLLMAGSAAA
jgi:simple sugar transport system ATP-binding protein